MSGGIDLLALTLFLLGSIKLQYVVSSPYVVQKKLCSTVSGSFGYGNTVHQHDHTIWGPSDWINVSPCCNGNFQSPRVLSDPRARGKTVCARGLKMDINYAKSAQYATLKNNGHAPTISFKNPGHSYVDYLNQRYILAQFHFHFGGKNSGGSEHSYGGWGFLRGKSFQGRGEMHLVHYNSKYSGFSEAVDKPDGLFVIGIFLATEGNVFTKWRARRQYINLFLKDKLRGFTGSSKDLTVIPTYLVPKDHRKFWAYKGSLTTPPCSESVIWVVLLNNHRILKDVWDSFRQMEDGHGGKIADHSNARPAQNNLSPVYANFHCSAFKWG